MKTELDRLFPRASAADREFAWDVCNCCNRLEIRAAMLTDVKHPPLRKSIAARLDQTTDILVDVIAREKRRPQSATKKKGA